MTVKLKQTFLGNKIPKENKYYKWIACVTIDSVIKIEKKENPQVFLEECKYRVKKPKSTKFINSELETDSESKSDTELMAKLESNSDSGSE